MIKNRRLWLLTGLLVAVAAIVSLVAGPRICAATQPEARAPNDRSSRDDYFSGAIPVTVSDYGVPAPDLGFVRVEPAGQVEFLVHFRQQ